MVSMTALVWFIVAASLRVAEGQEVDTTHGRVRGRTITVLGKSLDVFHGIPFAKPPVGELRFKHPQPADVWRPQVKDATKEAPSCIQSTHLYDMMPPSDSRRLHDDYSEDCLYLSIWKPSSAGSGSRLAVMIWIYGGGFAHGSTRIPLYNGQYMAANDVIVVSINYRVGPLGFSYLGPDTIPGNMGLMDQVVGMEWIRNNIENFGGNKDKITLFGQSTGGFSVGYHLLSPLSRDLFNNAVMQSGVPINKSLKEMICTTGETKESVRKITSAMKCPGSSDTAMFDCLKTASSEAITTAFCSFDDLKVYPVIDGYFLPESPENIIESGKHKKANILTGVTKDEITLFFGLFLDPTEKIVMSTGEPFSREYLHMGITKVTGLSDTGILNSLEIFYDSEQNAPVDYLKVLNYLGSDISLKCSTLEFSSLYTETNSVYLYSLNHRISTMPHPAWMGVPHSYDLDLVFGLPLNDSLGFTQDEKKLSRYIMKYWTNFAKSGDPNSPEPVTTNWSVFNTENLTYLALDVGSNLATRHGFRRHQCAFVNDILPMIPENIETKDACRPDSPCTSGSRRHSLVGCAYIVTSLHALLWMLK